MKRGIFALMAGLGAFLGLVGTALAEPLEIGKDLPKVEVKNHKGKVVNIGEAAAKGWTLVFFYPKAATGG